jgi:hypothetical protein
MYYHTKKNSSTIAAKKKKFFIEPKFNFNFFVELNNSIDSKLIITFYGKHYSKNVIKTWTHNKLWNYKISMEKAFQNAFLMYRKKFPEKAFDLVKMKTYIYNPVSRDDDANYDTLKPMRDLFTTFNIIEDDNRKVIIHSKEYEILTKRSAKESDKWKIIFEIEHGFNKENILKIEEIIKLEEKFDNLLHSDNIEDIQAIKNFLSKY